MASEEREISDVSMHWGESGLKKLTMRVTNGETGQHFVEYLDGAFNCDCFGFGRHAKCRHVESLTLMVKTLNNIRLDVYSILNSTARRNTNAY